VNNTTILSNDIYYRMVTTTCFNLLRPLSRFPPKEFYCCIRFMMLCHDGEVSSFVIFINITVKRRGCEGGRSVMWVSSNNNNNNK